MRTLSDWNGVEICLAESKRGVLAFQDPLTGLLRDGVPESEWPACEVAQKLRSKSRHHTAYQGKDLDAVVKKCGYYCDLQSIHSEDAITWSVFGPLIYAAETTRTKFCEKLFRLIEPSLLPPKSVKIFLWKRVLHPDTGSRSNGPETDFLLETAKVVVLGEAKWLSSVGTGQGANRDKDQITLRKEFCEKRGRGVYPTATTFVVLGISLDDNNPVTRRGECQVGDAKILLRNVSWESVCNIKPHPAEEELPKYFQWKKKYSRRN